MKPLLNQFKPFSLLDLWPALFFLAFVSSVFAPTPVLGYRWSAELALAILLLVSLLAGVIRGSNNFSRIDRREFNWVIAPLLLFIVWSALSILWSNSFRSAIHHTLVWACYLVFYVLLRTDQSRRPTKFGVLCVVILSISLAGITEYLGDVQGVSLAFKTQYYWYAEAVCALLPLLVALVATHQEKYWRLLITAGVLSSSALVILTQSRAMFLSGLIGLGSFLGLCWLIETSRSKKLIATTLIAAAAGVAIVLQMPLSGSERSSTLERLTGGNEQSQLSSNMRRLMWGMALEGFYSRPILGIGAGNYFADYKNLRKAYSAREVANPLLEVNEGLIPERAHNEPLQILSELGVVGLALFVCFFGGILYIFFRGSPRRSSLVSSGALCGMLAFIASSLVTSYSFRFPTNGICFFFLLSVLMNERGLDVGDDQLEHGTKRNGKFVFIAGGIAVTLSMIVFSSLRGLSIYYLGQSKVPRTQTAESDVRKAIAIDAQEPMFRFTYGQHLLLEGRYPESIPHLQIALENGLANSESFFTLGRALESSGQMTEAIDTFEEGLRVYPRSAFLRTAYASFLKRQGQHELADAEFTTAIAINGKQARSWQLAHDEGLERLVQVARLDENFVSTFELEPESAPLTLSIFQNPDRK